MGTFCAPDVWSPDETGGEIDDVRCARVFGKSKDGDCYHAKGPREHATLELSGRRRQPFRQEQIQDAARQMSAACHRKTPERAAEVSYGSANNDRNRRRSSTLSHFRMRALQLSVV